ncbi:MAG: ureidoglycolate lyase [Pseudomonadota bacterium]
MDLRLESLTAAAFAPFGDLLDLSAGGAPGRFDHVGRLVDGRGGLSPNVVLIRAAAEALPTRIERLERHAVSSQLFVPCGMAGRFLVVVAEDLGGRPALGTLRAFLCEGARGVIYAPGVWHHPLLSLLPCRFLMLVHEDGTELDTEVQGLDEPVRLLTTPTQGAAWPEPVQR